MSADGDSNAGGDLVPLDHAAAKLPVAYEAARQALEACERLDECQDWASRAEAMASYARQAKDESLRAMADRIQARAIRRCGELMQQIEPARGANQNIGEGALPKVTRESAAASAGLSEHQRKQALRVANVPMEEFDRAIERERPATVSELAKLGTSRKVPTRDDILEERKPAAESASLPAPAVAPPSETRVASLWAHRLFDIRAAIGRAELPAASTVPR